MKGRKIMGEIEVGDLIRWYEHEYPYYFIYEEYRFKAPTHGIVMQVHIPDPSGQIEEDLDFGFGKTKNILHWEEDMAWIKVLTIGENLQKRYIYLDFEEKYEIVSKVRLEKNK